MKDKLRKGQLMRRKEKLIAIVFALSSTFLLTSCNQEKQISNHEHTLENGDIQETTSSISELPAFLDSQSEQMKDIYTLVASHDNLLEHIPCYCGCGSSVGHNHNENCFIKERLKNGAIVWDDHATRCKVCLEIAVTSIKGFNEGMSIDEIRTFIDKTYQEGYAEPTATPL